MTQRRRRNAANRSRLIHERLEQRHLLAGVSGGYFFDGNQNNSGDPTEALSGVEVRILSESNGSVIDEVLTNQAGEFRFPDLPAGNYLLEAVAPAGVRTKNAQTVRSFASEVNNNFIPIVMQTGFFDQDANPDLFLVSRQGELRVLSWRTDHFEVLHQSFLGILEPQSAIVADLTGNGLSDIAISSGTTDGNLNVIRSIGNNQVSVDPPIPIAEFPRGIAAADFDKDGDIDLAVALNDSSQVLIMSNIGSGGFSGQQLIPAVPGIDTVRASDLNGDGKVDLVFGGLGSVDGAVGRIGVAMNQTPSPNALDFANLVSSSLSGAFTGLVADRFIDTNGDGTVDGNDSKQIAAFDILTRTVSILDSTTLDLLQSLNVSANIKVNTFSELTSGDFDSDGDLDLALASTNSTEITHLVNVSGQNFALRRRGPEIALTGESALTPSTEANRGQSEGEQSIFSRAFCTTLDGDLLRTGPLRNNSGLLPKVLGGFIFADDFDRDGDIDFVLGSDVDLGPSELLFVETTLVSSSAYVRVDNAPVHFAFLAESTALTTSQIQTSVERVSGGGTIPVCGRGQLPTSSGEHFSDLDKIVLEFDREVPLIAPSDIRFLSLGIDADRDDDVEISLGPSQLSLTGDQTKLTINLPHGVTADGVYEIQFLPSVTNGPTIAITGNRENSLFALRGDWTKDGIVDDSDFAAFAYWNGVQNRHPKEFDLSGDNRIGPEDFTMFAGNQGKQLVFPGEQIRQAVSAGNDAVLNFERSFRTLQTPSDVNGDGSTTSLDALNIINSLAREGTRVVRGWSQFNANQDEQVTALDALFVINRLGEATRVGSVQSEQIEHWNDNDRELDVAPTASLF